MGAQNFNFVPKFQQNAVLDPNFALLDDYFVTKRNFPTIFQ